MNTIDQTTMTPEQVYEERQKHQALIEKANKLERLQANPDFKELFMEDYCEKESQRLVSLFGDYAFNHDVNKERHREELNERMIGIARFQAYMRYLFMQAAMAEKTLYDLDHRDDENTEDTDTIL